MFLSPAISLIEVFVVHYLVLILFDLYPVCQVHILNTSK